MLKKCSKCKAEKEESEFGKNKTRPDGKQIWCKGCFSGYSAGKKAKKAEQQVTAPEVQETTQAPVVLEDSGNLQGPQSPVSTE